jgi:hypothetical protein
MSRAVKNAAVKPVATETPVASFGLPAEIAALVTQMSTPTQRPEGDNFTVYFDRAEFRPVTVSGTPGIVMRNITKPGRTDGGMFELHSSPMTLAELDLFVARALVARTELVKRLSRPQPATTQADLDNRPF